MQHVVFQRSRGLALAVAAALGAAHSTSPAVAAEPQTAALGEVVVTSRRVEERLQDTPIAVSAFQAGDIEKLNVRNVGDVASFTPNFISNPGPTGGNDGFFFIRGVGQTDLNPATDPGVGTYIDGVYLGRVMGASMDASDIARIEVLRGPQGTLFGRNTVGGAINITTRDPSDAFAASVLAGVGSRDLVNVRGSLDVPLGATSGLLVSAAYRDQDGWGRRASDGKIFDTNESRSGRLKYKWEPGEAFALTLSADMTKLTGTSQHTILTGFNPSPIPTGLSPLGVPLPDMTPYINTGDPYRNQSSIDPDKDYDVKGVGLVLDWKLGFGNLKSITSYRTLDQFITTDYDSTAFAFYEGGFDTDQKQWSQELQLTGETGRFKWLLGAFYYDENNKHNNIVSLGGNNGCLPFPVPTSGYPLCNFAGGQAYATPGVNRRITNNQRFELDVKAKALFGQTSIRLTDRLSATLGLRWTDEKKNQDYDFFIDNSQAVATAFGLPPFLFPTLSPRNPANTAPTAYEASWSEVTPKVGLEYKPSADVLYYVSWSKGFKSGGFAGRPNPGANGQFGRIDPYDPEKMDAYEIGAKTQFADDRVRLNVALFQSNYKGIQLLALDFNTGFFNTVNAAESRIRGAEIELQARPIPALELQAGIGYTDDEYQELSPGVQVSGLTYDMHLPLTPKLNGSLGAQYTWEVANGTFALRGDYAYRSEYWYEAVNTEGNRQGGFGVLNARATYEFGDGAWAVAAYGLNLTDKVYATNVQDIVGPLGVRFESVSAPREWGVEVRYKFGR
jgi:iron complex outermembrane receptor protein